tara:strand:+ start:2614 stop:2805 length:192 start_codon:yes stop_codon:yes gene_type:complete
MLDLKINKLYKIDDNIYKLINIIDSNIDIRSYEEYIFQDINDRSIQLTLYKDYGYDRVNDISK